MCHVNFCNNSLFHLFIETTLKKSITFKRVVYEIDILLDSYSCYYCTHTTRGTGVGVSHWEITGTNFWALLAKIELIMRAALLKFDSSISPSSHSGLLWRASQRRRPRAPKRDGRWAHCGLDCGELRRTLAPHPVLSRGHQCHPGSNDSRHRVRSPQRNHA